MQLFPSGLSLRVCCSVLLLLSAVLPCLAEEHKIGLILPLTGPAATNGKSMRGVEKVLQPHSLRFLYENDKCDSKLGLAAYRKLHEQGVRVFFVACSSSVLAIAPIAKRNADLILTSYAGSSRIRDTGDEVIRMNPDAVALAESMRRLLPTYTERTVILHEEQDYATSLADMIAQDPTRNIVKRVPYLADGRSFIAEVLSIKAAHPQNIFLLPVADGAAKLLLQQLAQYKITAQILGEVNLCDFPFSPKDFGLHGKCTIAEFHGTEYDLFLQKYHRAVGYPSIYPFYDALAYDLLVYMDSFETKDFTVPFLKASILKGFRGKFARYSFSPDGEIKNAFEYLQLKQF